MLCGTHNYEYELFIGKCPYCEAENRANAARDLAEEAAHQRTSQLELARSAIEQSQLQHEEMLDAQERHLDSMAEMDEQRLRRLEEMEEQRQRNHEETLERERLAKIAHEVEVLCRSADRKLAAGRASEAQEDAERALDQDPNDETALSLAYFAAKKANRDASVSTGYLDRWIQCVIERTPSHYQAASSTFDRLIVEAAGSALGADRLVSKLVDAYRSAPENLRDTLAKIGRPELLGSWLDARLKQTLVEKIGFPIKSLLDSIAALSDGPTRISSLAENLVENGGFHAPVAEWLKIGGYAKDVATYVRSCVTGSNGRGFDNEFSEWMIANGYLNDASNYLVDHAAGCDVATRVCTLIPLGIETSRRMDAPTSDWISMLNTDLATLPVAKIAGSALQSNLLSRATKEDVIKAMIGHVKHVIKGPEAYRLGAGLQKSIAGDYTVYSVRSGKNLERPLLHLNAPLVGGVCGMAVWLLPGGEFFLGIKWGLLVTTVVWIWKYLYRLSKSEISASIVGKYCYEYCAVLEGLGADKRATSTVISNAPNANPLVSYLTVLGTVGVLTALISADGFLSAGRLASSNAAALAARTASGEWIQDWGMSANGDRLIARLYEEGEGKLTVRGYDTSWSGVASENPRFTAQLTGCNTTKLAVSCVASYSVLGRNEYQNILGRFDLDFPKRTGLISVTAPNEPPFTMIVQGTPSSISGAPKALLQHAVGVVEKPPSVLPTLGGIATTPSGPGSTGLLPTEGDGAREQLNAETLAQEMATRQEAGQELSNQRKVEQSAGTQRRIAEADARSRYDITLAEAQRVYEHELADARSTQRQAQSQAQLDSRQALAETQRNLRVEQATAEAKYKLAQQIAQKIPALQATTQAAFQQEQAEAQARYQQAQASVQAIRQQAESEATAVYQKAHAEAQSALRQARAEAQKRYQIERDNRSVQDSKVPTADARPVHAL